MAEMPKVLSLSRFLFGFHKNLLIAYHSSPTRSTLVISEPSVTSRVAKRLRRSHTICRSASADGENNYRRKIQFSKCTPFVKSCGIKMQIWRKSVLRCGSDPRNSDRSETNLWGAKGTHQQAGRPLGDFHLSTRPATQHPENSENKPTEQNA